MSLIELARSDEIIEGIVRVSSAAGHNVAITRVNGTVCAFENKCPHMGLSLARGKISDGTITCPFHGSRFEICSGKNLTWANSVLGARMPGWSHKALAMGKPPADLKIIEVTERDGKVLAKLP